MIILSDDGFNFDASNVLIISSATYTPDSNKDYSFWFFFFDFFEFVYII